MDNRFKTDGDLIIIAIFSLFVASAIYVAISACMCNLLRQATLRGIKNGSVEFQKLPATLRDDAVTALAAIRQCQSRGQWEHVSVRLKSNKEFVMTAVKVWGGFLGYVSRDLRADREVVSAAVQQCSCALSYASEELRGDQDVVLTAVRHHGGALQHASNELRGNREIVWEAVRQDGRALEYASDELRGNQEIVLEAVRRDGKNLRYASAELRGARKIVLAAVEKSGYALRHASEELRSDRQIALEAVQQDAWALEFAAAEIWDDQEILLVALDNVHYKFEAERILGYASKGLQNDPVVVGAAIRKGVRLREGSEIMSGLENVVLTIRAQPKHFIDVVDGEESLFEFYKLWEQSIWQKISMALQLEPPGMQGTGRLFVELSGLPVELQQAKELRYFAPVIRAVLSFPDRDWRDLESYT